jgi:heat shock protein 4
MSTDELPTSNADSTTQNQEDNLDDVKLANSTEASSKANKQPEAKKQKKPKVQVISLPIESFVPGMSKSEIDLGLEKEGKMAAQDKLEKERADAKNAVEEYVYEMREKLDAQLQNFISEKDKESFSSLLTRTEDWLYDEGEDEQKNVYVDKLAQLRVSIQLKARVFSFYQ